LSEGDEHAKLVEGIYLIHYLCTRTNPELFQVHDVHFSTVAHIARDFLCIPASSVSVERLFSQCKLTLSDVRSSMSFETARRRICCQHWMKAGVDEEAIRAALEID
jgi:hypothetical protein